MPEAILSAPTVRPAGPRHSRPGRSSRRAHGHAMGRHTAGLSAAKNGMTPDFRRNRREISRPIFVDERMRGWTTHSRAEGKGDERASQDGHG